MSAAVRMSPRGWHYLQALYSLRDVYEDARDPTKAVAWADRLGSQLPPQERDDIAAHFEVYIGWYPDGRYRDEPFSDDVPSGLLPPYGNGPWNSHSDSKTRGSR